jgi:hypothetical protein
MFALNFTSIIVLLSWIFTSCAVHIDLGKENLLARIKELTGE